MKETLNSLSSAEYADRKLVTVAQLVLISLF